MSAYEVYPIFEWWLRFETKYCHVQQDIPFKNDNLQATFTVKQTPIGKRAEITIFSSKQKHYDDLSSTVFLKDKDGKQQCIQRFQHLTLGSATHVIWEANNNALKKIGEEFLIDGDISFFGIICPSSISNSVFFSGQGMLQDFSHGGCLQGDFKSIFSSKIHSDVILKCGSESFSAHKVILTACSGVFEAMLRNEMKENTDGVVTVSEMDSSILEIMLRFIYTGELPAVSWETVQKVYASADRYDIIPLNNRCISDMVEGLNENNLLEILDLAFKHGDVFFKNAVMSHLTLI